MKYNLLEDNNFGTFLLGVGAGTFAMAASLVITVHAELEAVYAGTGILVICFIAGFRLIRQAERELPKE